VLGRHRETMLPRSPLVGYFRPAIPDFAIARPEGRSRASIARTKRAFTPVFASYGRA